MRELSRHNGTYFDEQKAGWRRRKGKLQTASGDGMRDQGDQSGAEQGRQQQDLPINIFHCALPG
jgi:hypothetical protein